MKLSLARLATVSSAIVVGACNNPSVAPNATVTLLVENATCTAEGCGELNVFAFPNSSYITPGGPWRVTLGSVTTASACLVIPASAEAHITDAGTGQTTTFTWHTSQALALGAKQPLEKNLFPLSSTPEFIPR
ncbi:MAG: hypothetical protein ABIT38_20810, partial [Gemmatimonadaceae bacterium]